MVDHPGAEAEVSMQDLVDELDELVPYSLLGRAEYTVDDVTPILEKLETKLYVVLYHNSILVTNIEADEVDDEIYVSS